MKRFTQIEYIDTMGKEYGIYYVDIGVRLNDNIYIIKDIKYDYDTSVIKMYIEFKYKDYSY